MRLFQASFSPSWVRHPAEVPSHRPTMDRLPSELVELICLWIHADKTTISKPVHRIRFMGSEWDDVTQFTRTLAKFSLASKRYREIALPFMYSHITVEEYDSAQLPLFVYTLCRNPTLRPLVKQIEVRCLPYATDVNVQLMGTVFEDTATQFSLPPLDSWSRDECPNNCNRQNHTCIHCIRLLSLLVLLPSRMNCFCIRPPQFFHFDELASVTQMPKTETVSPLHALQQLWIPGGLGPSVEERLEVLSIPHQLQAWLVPNLLNLRLRNACLFETLPVTVNLDNLQDITLDIGLLTTRGLFSLTAACKTLANFHFYSRGSNSCFPDAAYPESFDFRPYREFIPEDIVPAFSHLKGTLKTLAINRWDGVRGDADQNIALDSENQEYYATWPERIGNGRLIASLKDFTTLETLKLDSTCLFHRPNEGLPSSLPADHLTARLPGSLRRLTLPGAPPQMVPALHALAAAAAAGNFPLLKLVEVTSDQRDALKREMSLRLSYPQPEFLVDNYTRFVSRDDWDSLEQEFATAGILFSHIDSGNTDCFARDVLVKEGLLEAEGKVPWMHKKTWHWHS